jgi:uncharacterized protein (TIGR03663 family)
LVVLALFLASFYRLPYLDTRPMHADEAILGVKFIEFAQTGHFDYDPADYHGPVLHYITRAYGWFAGWSDLAQLQASSLRRVVVLCSLLLILATLLLGDALGRLATASSMLIMAVSPMMVFYSRYYIMEVPFILWLTLFMASGWRYSQSKNPLWQLLAGTTLGLMHATKETFIINLCAMLCGWIAVRVLGLSFDKKSSAFSSRSTSARPAIIVTTIAIAVSVTLFSGFYRHWDDVVQSVTTYGHYLHRSGGAGHEKPWHYYLGLLCWQKEGYGYLWTELIIVALAIIGALHSLISDFRKHEHQQAFRVFLAVYALAALVAYSILPYKTPWVILSVQHALTLLAGLGVQSLYTSARSRIIRSIIGTAFLASIYHLCMQTMRTIHDSRGKISNPYLYSHTGTRVIDLATQVRQLSTIAGDSFALQVFTRDAGWPLPWYLRDLKNATYSVAMPDALTAPIIIADSALYAQAKAKLTAAPSPTPAPSPAPSLSLSLSPSPAPTDTTVTTSSPSPVAKTYYEDTFNTRQGVSAVLLVEQSLWDRYIAKRGIKP